MRTDYEPEFIPREKPQVVSNDPHAPQVCLYCDKTAVRSFIYGDNYYTPVCDEHDEKAREEIKKAGFGIDDIIEIEGPSPLVYPENWGLRARGRIKSALSELKTPKGKQIPGTQRERPPKDFLKALGTDWNVLRANKVSENRMTVTIDGQKYTLYSRTG